MPLAKNAIAVPWACALGHKGVAARVVVQVSMSGETPQSAGDSARHCVRVARDDERETISASDDAKRDRSTTNQEAPRDPPARKQNVCSPRPTRRSGRIQSLDRRRDPNREPFAFVVTFHRRTRLRRCAGLEWLPLSPPDG
jgi:hypothetical protein